MVWAIALSLLSVEICSHAMSTPPASSGSAMKADTIIEVGDVAMVRIRSSSHGKDDEEIARVALCLYFDDEDDCEVLHELRHYIKGRVTCLRNSEDDSCDDYEKLSQIKSIIDASKKHHISHIDKKKIYKNKELNHVINRIVKESLQDYGRDKDRAIEFLEKRAARKECHKRIAIGVSIASIIIASATAIGIAFIP